MEHSFIGGTLLLLFFHNSATIYASIFFYLLPYISVDIYASIYVTINHLSSIIFPTTLFLYYRFVDGVTGSKIINFLPFANIYIYIYLTFGPRLKK